MGVSPSCVVPAWMSLGGVVLNEVSETRKGTLHNVTFMWNLKRPSRVARGWGTGDKEQMLVQGHQPAVTRSMKPADLTCVW